MRSFLASIRTLVLPYGATSGPRIILDGVTGAIRIYSAANVEVGHLVADSGSGLAELKLSGPGGSDMGMGLVDGGGAVLFFQPGSLVNNTWIEGQLLTGTFAGRPYTEWNSPNDAVAGLYSAIQLFGSSNAFPTDSHINLNADSYIAVTAPKLTVNAVTPVLSNEYTELGGAGGTAVTGITTAETVVHSMTAANLTVGNTYEVDWFATWSTDTAGCQVQFRMRLGTTTAGASARVFRDQTPTASDPYPVFSRTRFVATATTQGLCATMIRTGASGTAQRRGAADNDVSTMTCREVVNAA